MQFLKVLCIFSGCLVLQACLATKIVTVPVKVAYGTTKVVVKGTAKAVEAVIPGDSDSPDKK